MQCYEIHFYFRKGHKKRLLQGLVCGCVVASSRETAIEQAGPFDRKEGETLVKVTARPKRPGHICTEEWAERRDEGTRPQLSLFA